MTIETDLYKITGNVIAETKRDLQLSSAELSQETRDYFSDFAGQPSHFAGDEPARRSEREALMEQWCGKRDCVLHVLSAISLDHLIQEVSGSSMLRTPERSVHID